jgi:hypothetical protein
MKGEDAMSRTFQTTAALLTLALLAGCGATPGAVGARTQAATAAQAADVDVQVRKLIAQVQALKSFDERATTERIHLYGALGRTDSDRAADFLLVELLEGWETWPARAQDTLEQPLLNALYQLGGEEAVPAGMVSSEAARKRRKRFNIWDGVNKFFGVKKRKRKSSGGNPPAPAPAPASDPLSPAGPLDTPAAF